MKRRRHAASGAILLGGLLLGLSGGCSPALREPPALTTMAGTEVQPADGDAEDLLARARTLHTRRNLPEGRQAARLALQASLNPNTRQAGLEEAARILVWLTEHEESDGARQEAAVQAVDAAIWCTRHAARQGPCDYWLGAALGVQARERRSTGLSALPEIEAAFQRALVLVPQMEHAAPDRALALLYLRAPGWPGGPGDAHRGLEHARAAVALFPAYPPNLLALAEALERTGDRDGARGTWQQVIDAATGAGQEGDPDAGEWLQEARRELSRFSRP